MAKNWCPFPLFCPPYYAYLANDGHVQVMDHSYLESLATLVVVTIVVALNIKEDGETVVLTRLRT